MDTGSSRAAGEGAELVRGGRLPQVTASLAVLLVLGGVLWFAFGMQRGVLLATGVESRAWPWAPLLKGREPEAQVLSDPVWQFVPWLRMARRELRAGRIPLWNPHQNGGQPLLGNAQSALGSPLVWPVLILGVERGWNLSLLLRLLVALSGAFLWLENAGRSPWAAALGALMFGLSGAFVAWLEYPNTLVAAWVPWLLLAVERLLESSTRLRMAGMVVITAIVLAEGQPETTLPVVLLAGLLLAWRSRLRRPAVAVMSAAALGLGLAMPLLLPFAEYLFHSAAWQGSGRHPFVLPLAALVRFVAPHAAVGHPIEAAATVSVTGLLLAACGLWLGRGEGDCRFWAVVGTVLLLVAYDTPLGRLVATETPLYGSRVLLLLPLAAGFLAARGLDGLLLLPQTARRRLAVAVAIPLLAGAELLTAARGVNPVSPHGEVGLETPLIRFLRARKGPFRILPLHTFLPPESATLYGLDDVRGYDALAPAGWLRQRSAMGRFTALSMVSDVLEPWDVAPGGEALDYWNVKYLLIHPQFDLTPKEWGQPLGLHLKTVYDGPDGRVLRNLRALPRVRCEDGGEVHILGRTPLRWEVDADCTAAGRLVVADPWFPGWKVFVDGAGVPLHLAPGEPITVALSAGKHRVEVVYRPLSFFLGLWLAAGALAVLGLWMWQLPGGRRHPSPPLQS